MLRFIRSLSLSALFLAAPAAWAHFPFVVPNQNGAPEAKLVFSETLEPDDEVGIEMLAGAKLVVTDKAGKQTPLTMEKGTHLYKVSLLGVEPVVISGEADLGVMQRGKGDPHRLVYYPKTIVGDAFNPKATTDAKVELIPSGKPGELKLKLVADGKPVVGGEVAVIPQGKPEERFKTDDQGLTPALAAPGRYAAWARSWEEKSGEVGGKTYKQVRSYATLVIDVGGTATASAGRKHGGHGDPTAGGETPDPKHKQHAFPMLPEATSSFGAAIADGYLYVYGGHIAKTHKYDTEAVSGKFNRLKLDGGTKWEPLPAGPGLQGMNLASYDGKIYRIGGMQPKNAPGTKADTHSVADCTVYDPAAGKWSPLASLPQPRSSHDFAIVGDKLYVIGGWWMQGKEGEEWPAEGLVLDLKDPAAQWKPLKQPFARRALIVTVQGSKIYAIGGFTEDSDPMRTVNVYDTATDTWTTGPVLPGKDLNGFAPAACTHEGRVFASVGDGSLFRLTEKGDAWEKVTTTTPRIVHRLAPWGSQILVVGGAIRGNNLDLVEAVQLGADAQAASDRLPKAPESADAAVAK